MRTITTSVIVLHPAESKLLCVRHPSFGAWMFPGGRVEADEAPHVAALREVVEEVGLTVTLADLSGLPRWSRNGNSRLPQPFAMIEEKLPDETGFYVDVVFIGFAHDALISLNSEVAEAGWFGLDDLDRLPTSYPIQEMAASVFDRMNDLRT